MAMSSDEKTGDRPAGPVFGRASTRNFDPVDGAEADTDTETETETDAETGSGPDAETDTGPDTEELAVDTGPDTEELAVDTGPDTEELAVEPDPGTEAEAEADAIAVGVPDEAESEAESEAEAEFDVDEGAAADEVEDRWTAAKVVFVDEPGQAVERAAALATEALRARCQAGEDASTEAPRQAFLRYREVYDLLRS
jgi:hypothetical protein